MAMLYIAEQVMVMSLPGCLNDTDCYLPSVGNQKCCESFHSRHFSSHVHMYVRRTVWVGCSMQRRQWDDDQYQGARLVFYQHVRYYLNDTLPEWFRDIGRRAYSNQPSARDSTSFPAALSLSFKLDERTQSPRSQLRHGDWDGFIAIIGMCSRRKT
jgi:hypothetical protein